MTHDLDRFRRLCGQYRWLAVFMVGSVGLLLTLAHLVAPLVQWGRTPTLTGGRDVAASLIWIAPALCYLFGVWSIGAGMGQLARGRLIQPTLASTLRRVGLALGVVEMRADAGRRVAGYSLGMRQRLGLARAMLGAPPVLVLDEPTNGLDPDGIAEMRGFLRSLPGRTGATVLLSSHLLGEIEQIATHVGVVHQGRLVLEGELAALKAAEACEILLRVDDPQRAAAVLRRWDLTLVEGADGMIARLRPGQDHDVIATELNRALVEQGVGVFAFGARERSLEGLYRQVTENTQPLPEAA